MLTSINTAENDYYDSGWRKGLPWLYYVANAKDVIQKDKRMKGRIELQSDSTSTLGLLRFIAAKYSLEGDFLGYENFTTQLQLCGADYEYGKDYREFGTTVKTSCNFDASELITSSIQPNNTDVFYELFLIDTSDNYIDVPVKINNYVDSNGDKPNESSNIKDWKLTRRFFIFDTKSGIEGSGSYSDGDKYSSYIRWLYKVKIVVELDPNGNDQMFIPYVELEYRSKALSFIPNSSLSHITFEAVYKFDSSAYWLVALIFFAVINAFILIITAWKIFCWTRRHPSQLMGSVYGIKLVYKIIFFFCETWSTLMFWYLFGISASLYGFFKLSTSPYLILFQDENNNLTPWAVIFAFVFVFKLAVII